MPTLVPYTLLMTSHKNPIITVPILQIRIRGSSDTHERGKPGYEPSLSSAMGTNSNHYHNPHLKNGETKLRKVMRPAQGHTCTSG